MQESNHEKKMLGVQTKFPSEMQHKCNWNSYNTHPQNMDVNCSYASYDGIYERVEIIITVGISAIFTLIVLFDLALRFSV